MRDPHPHGEKDLPCDFLTYLSERSQLERAVLAEVLGDWLVTRHPGLSADCGRSRRLVEVAAA